MIDYKTALELLNVGYPMKLALPESRLIWGGTDTGGTIYQFPTLSELIEACGDEFYELRHNSTAWVANSFRKGTCCGYDAGGKTPDEAVVKLYIKLNKKK